MVTAEQIEKKIMKQAFPKDKKKKLKKKIKTLKRNNWETDKKWGKHLTGQTIMDFYNEETDEEVTVINAINYEKDKRWFVVFQKAGTETKEKSFKTKSEALEFARKYMKMRSYS